MQTQTMAAAPKRGMKLQYFNNPKSIRKAQEMKPDVQFRSFARSDVQRSDRRSYARVEFFLIGSEIWASCDCHAAFRALPCYHVAAAAISNGIISVPAGTEIAVRDDLPTSLAYDACARTARAARDRFRPAPTMARHEIDACLDWLNSPDESGQDVDTQIDDFINVWGSDKLNWLYDHGYITFDGDLVYAIEPRINTVQLAREEAEFLRRLGAPAHQF